MSENRYCNVCKEKTYPVKKFNWIVFIIGLICLLIIGIIYVIYYLTKDVECPQCHNHSWGAEPTKRIR